MATPSMLRPGNFGASYESPSGNTSDRRRSTIGWREKNSCWKPRQDLGREGWFERPLGKTRDSLMKSEKVMTARGFSRKKRGRGGQAWTKF